MLRSFRVFPVQLIGSKPRQNMKEREDLSNNASLQISNFNLGEDNLPQKDLQDFKLYMKISTSSGKQVQEAKAQPFSRISFDLYFDFKSSKTVSRKIQKICQNQIGQQYKSYCLFGCNNNKMQKNLKTYNSLGIVFYNIFKSSVVNNSITPYLSYAINTAITHFPKIAYQNPYQPQYTRPSVKYNAPIVVTLILATLWASRVAVAEEEHLQIHNQ